MKEEPIHEVHCLSYSKYIDKKIVLTLPFTTPRGIPLELSFNENGNVVLVQYYRERDPNER